MKSALFSSVLVLLFLVVQSEISAQQSTFSSHFLDPYSWGSSAQAYSAAETVDSGFIVVGYRELNGLILKTDHDGLLVWDKMVDFGFSHAILYRIIPTDDQNFVVAGTGNSDILVMKITQDGDTLWTRSVDFGKFEYVSHVEQTDDQGYILCGYGTTGGSSYELRMLVAKLDAEGWLEWGTTMVTADPRNEAHAIRQLTDGTYILTGWATSPYPDQPYAFFVNLSAQGEIQWSKRLEFTNPPFPLYGSKGFDIQPTEEGFVCLAADAYSTNLMLIGMDPWGNTIQFATQRNGMSGFSPNLYQEVDPKLSQTSSGDWAYVSMGQWGGLYQSDEAGIGTWSKTLEMEVVDLIVTRDGGMLIIGNGPLWGVSNPYPYNLQIGLIKTDSAGNESDYCSWDASNPSSIFSASLEPLVMDTTWGATVSSLQVTYSASGLAYYPGCVEITPGVAEQSQEKTIRLMVSPNPTDGLIQIQTEPSGKNLEFINIYNTSGSLVHQLNENVSLPAKPDLSCLPNGIYFIRALIDQTWYSEKLILIR